MASRRKASDMATSLSPDVLAAYMRTFYGYGAWTAKYWFVGMEEGGGSTLEEIARRVRAWRRRGRRDLEDLRDYHLAIDAPRYFAGKPPLQRTWRALLRVVLAARGAAVDLDILRAYQSTLLGRAATPDAETALIEVLPIPGHGMGERLYVRLGLTTHQRRKQYEATLARTRTAAIIGKIDQFQPRAVVTYGNMHAWCRTFRPDCRLNADAWVSFRGRTTIVCTYHPEGGRSHAHWDEIGRFLAAGSAPTTPVDQVG